MEQMRRKKKVKREFIEIDGMLIFERKAFFKDYLETQIGANWFLIKRSLFDAGYTAEETNEYRNKLLNDFRSMCKEHGFTEYI